MGLCDGVMMRGMAAPLPTLSCRPPPHSHPHHHCFLATITMAAPHSTPWGPDLRGTSILRRRRRRRRGRCSGMLLPFTFSPEADRGGDEDEASDSAAARRLRAAASASSGGLPESDLAQDLPPPEGSAGVLKLSHDSEVLEERAYLVGIECKGANAMLDVKDSLDELAQLADTAGLLVVGSTYQKLDYPSPKTYIGSGKVAEVKAAIHAFNIETVIFDDELSPGQLRNLEKAFGNDVRVCDRTALILDIFSQRAATREAALQVELAKIEYQLPRLTRMWTHLERQAGGMVKGMGEKQIEVDKRILRNRMSRLKRDLESICEHRQHYRDRRAAVPIPVVSLVGYTNAGKSTLMNRLSGAGVLTEDRLFATLDPTTRCIQLPNGKQCLITDTVGFIQKLPTQLVASFRATLEEICDSSLLVHVVDISHPLARQHIQAVKHVLSDINVIHIPQIVVWNKIDKASNQEILQDGEFKREDVIRISALTGEGMQEFCKVIESRIKESLVLIEAVLPYIKGDLLDAVHRLGIVDQVEYGEDGVSVKAHVPLSLSRQMQLLQQSV